jgi:3-deoxy-D-manno-octulosonic-acid transferase
MALLYNIGIYIYIFAVNVASFFNPKAKSWVEGRKNLLNKIQEVINPADKIIWMHCASLGEFEQGRPVLEAAKKEFPEHKILLTFFSPSGYEVRKSYPLADYIFYLPADTPSNARKFIDIVRPSVAVFVKYEFWNNFITELNQRKIPLLVISAIFREEQVFFKWYGGFFLDILKKIESIYVQDEHSLKLLQEKGVKATIAGDTRFDRVNQSLKSKESISVVENFAGNSPIFIAGSTWPEDETLIVDLIKNSPAEWKFLIAPHETNSAHLLSLTKKLDNIFFCFFSSYTEDFKKSKVMIIDTIGHLSKIYRYGEIAFIGGGFGKGIHNTLEAAAFGLPVIFGPEYSKFKEANDLIKKGGAFSVKSFQELQQAFNDLLKEEKRSAASKIASKYVQENTGATMKILKKMKNILT